MKVKFIVEYNDDFNKHHITFATSMAEVRFIEARFFKIKVTPCSQFWQVIIGESFDSPFFYALVTQLVEYQTFNLRVAGSNPAGRISTHTAIFTRNRRLICEPKKRVEFLESTQVVMGPFL